jgi:hypothetical protein
LIPLVGREGKQLVVPALEHDGRFPGGLGFDGGANQDGDLLRFNAHSPGHQRCALLNEQEKLHEQVVSSGFLAQEKGAATAGLALIHQSFKGVAGGVEAFAGDRDIVVEDRERILPHVDIARLVAHGLGIGGIGFVQGGSRPCAHVVEFQHGLIRHVPVRLPWLHSDFDAASGNERLQLPLECFAARTQYEDDVAVVPDEFHLL